MAVHSNQYGKPRSMVIPKGRHDVDSLTLLQASVMGQFNALNQRFDNMNLNGASSSSSEPQRVNVVAGRFVEATCDNCGNFENLAQYFASPVEQVNAFQYFRQNNNSYPNHYYESYKNHPNLSYQSNNVLNPPQQQPQQPPNTSNPFVLSYHLIKLFNKTKEVQVQIMICKRCGI